MNASIQFVAKVEKLLLVLSQQSYPSFSLMCPDLDQIAEMGTDELLLHSSARHQVFAAKRH